MPYEFSVLGADTLGNIYEQFLGKVIRLTAGHQAKIEEKLEVKKPAESITPPNISLTTSSRIRSGNHRYQKSQTNFRAQNTGSRLRLRLFPAWAYQYLLDYHTKWYTEHYAELGKKALEAIYQGPRDNGF